MSDHKISKQEIINAIENSGYLIEQREEPIINSFGFVVESNDVYKDDGTGKTREIDFTAISANFIYGGHILFPYLIGECENNKQPIVFFRSESHVSFLFHEEVKLSGLPIYLFKSSILDKPVRLNKFLLFEKFHHYCKGSFSTQYCSFQLTNKNGVKKWIASHLENQHDTFQNIIKCLNNKIKEHFSCFALPKEGYREVTNIQLYYPVLILQGDLYEAYLENNELKLEPQKHIQYRKQVINNLEQEMYHIDVITEDYLEEYLNIIVNEINEIVTRLKRKKKELQNSIDFFIEKLYKAKDKSEYQNILECNNA